LGDDNLNRESQIPPERDIKDTKCRFFDDLLRINGTAPKYEEISGETALRLE